MKVLYYVEPRVEMEDPYFRYGTYKSVLLPEIQALLSAAAVDISVDSCDVSENSFNVVESSTMDSCSSSLQVAIVLSRDLYLHAKEKGAIDERVTYFCVPDSLKMNCGGDIRNTDLGLWLSENTSVFEPDVVLLYENSDRSLLDFWSGAISVNVMFGMFSRAPFPTLACYDPVGIYQNSFLSVNSNDIEEIIWTSEEIAFLRDFKRTALAEISRYNPFKRDVLEFKQEYGKVVLLPCQVDGHVAFSGCSDYQRHYDLIIETLSLLSENDLLLVTQHQYRPVLDDQQIFELESKYQNFILFSNEKNIPDVSQFILPYVDACISVSSSLGYQAALWSVPLCCPARSQISPFSSFDSVAKLVDFLSSESSDFVVKSNDSLLLFGLLRYNKIYRSEIFKGDNYFQFISDLYKSLKSDPSGKNWFFERKIDLEYIRGEMFEAFRGWQLKQYFSRRKDIHICDYLMLGIATHSVVTFDLFDTLIERPLTAPHNIFLGMESKIREILNNKNFPFWDLRRRSEGEVRRPTKGDVEINLDQIYDKLQELSGLTDEHRDLFMQMELEAELSVCREKSSMRVYRKYAKMLCDEVGIISDFYIDQGFVEKLISEKNISCDFLYVSATERTRKHNGSIYPKLIKRVEQNGFDRKDILHVGDNRVADGEMARLHGIDNYVFPAAMENFKKSALGRSMQKAFGSTSCSDGILPGVISGRLNSAPFNQFDNDSFFRGRPFNLGYAGYGPLVVGFCVWLDRIIKNYGVKDVFFLARDGHIIKEVLDRYGSKDISYKYLYASRRAFSVPACQNLAHLKELAFQSFNSQLLEDFMLNRFGFDLQGWKYKLKLRKSGLRSDSVISHQYDLGKLSRLMEELEEELLQHCQQEREALFHYLAENGITPDRIENVLLVDIGYSGTMQYQLARMMPNLPIAGAYYLTHHHALETLPAGRTHAYLSEWDDHRSGYRHHLNDFVFVYEAGFSKAEGSLVCFEKTGETVKPILLDEGVEARRNEVLHAIHRGILEFSKDFYSNIPDYFHGDIPPLLATRVMNYFSESPYMKDSAIFLDNGVENNFGGGSVSLIYPIESNRPSADQLKLAIDQSKWKQGARAYYSRYDSSLASVNVNGGMPTKKFEPPVGEASPSRRVTSSSVLVVDKEKKAKKLAKLGRNPYLFFADAKSPGLRRLKILFGPGALGRVNTKIVRFVVDYLV